MSLVILCPDLSFAHSYNRRRRATQFPGDINLVARPRPGPQNRRPFRRRSHHDDIGLDSTRRLCRVPARERNPELLRRFEQPSQKTVHPLLRNSSIQCHRQECRPWLATHSGDIAQSPRQASPSHYFRRMPLPPEMHVLQREVGRNQQVVTNRHAQHGSVVSDPGYDRSTGANPAPDPLDQRFLS